MIDINHFQEGAPVRTTRHSSEYFSAGRSSAATREAVWRRISSPTVRARPSVDSSEAVLNKYSDKEAVWRKIMSPAVHARHSVSSAGEFDISPGRESVLKHIKGESASPPALAQSDSQSDSQRNDRQHDAKFFQAHGDEPRVRGETRSSYMLARTDVPYRERRSFSPSQETAYRHIGGETSSRSLEVYRQDSDLMNVNETEFKDGVRHAPATYEWIVQDSSRGNGEIAEGQARYRSERPDAVQDSRREGGEKIANSGRSSDRQSDNQNSVYSPRSAGKGNLEQRHAGVVPSSAGSILVAAAFSSAEETNERLQQLVASLPGMIAVSTAQGSCHCCARATAVLVGDLFLSADGANERLRQLVSSSPESIAASTSHVLLPITA